MLKLSKLDKIYKSKSGEKVQALTNVDLNFGHKGFVFILGKSGSGKSTLLNIIGGLDDFTKGDIEIKGKSSKNFKAKDWDSYRNTYVGFVFQEFHIIESYSIAKNISLALELQGIQKKDIKPRVKAILKQVDLEQYGDRKPNELSGGQKQRIAIARALVKNPEIMLADEPTGNLDEETGTQIIEILRQLAEEKLVIMVSHDKEAAYKYADRIITMTDGRISSDRYNEGGLKYISEEIEGYRTEGELTSVIRIPKGKNIDKEINSILAKGDGDIYIPLVANKQLTSSDLVALNRLSKKFGDVLFLPIIKDITKIQGSKNKKHQGRINPAKDSLKKETSPFQLIKTMFPFRNTISMAFSAIWRKKFKVIFSSIIFLLAIGLFGFSETVTRFDFAKAITNSYEVGTIEEIALSNRVEVLGWGNDFVDTAQAASPFELSEITSTMSKYPLLSYGRIYDFPNQAITVSTDSTFVSLKKLKGFLELEDVNSVNMEIAEGKFPETFSQIMLTDFYADYLIVENTEYTKYADIINTGYFLDNREYTISGIADTDYEDHLYLNDLPASEVLKMLAEVGTYTMSHDSKYSRVIVKQGFYAEVYNDVPVFANIYSANTPKADAKDEWETNWLANAFLAYDSEMLNNPRSDQYLFVPEGFTGLKEDEMIVTMDALSSLNELDIQETIQNVVNSAMSKGDKDGSEILAEFKDNGWIPTEAIEVSIVSEQDWERIAKHDMKIVGVIDFWGYTQTYNTDYMYNYVIDNGGSFTAQELTEQSRREGFYDHSVRTEYLKTRLRKEGLSVPHEETFNYSKYGDYYNYLQALANENGITTASFFENVYSPIVMEKDSYDNLNPFDKSKLSGILVSLSSDSIQNQEFFTDIYDKGYQHKTLPGTVLGTFDDFVEEAAGIFRYVSLGLAAFSILLMSTNISASVLASKKEIGTLRAIGAKGIDVSKIFVTEAVFLASFVAVLANIALVFITQILNSNLSDQIGIPLSIFNPSIIIAGELMLLAVLVGFIASFLPARGVTLMKPIDAILER